MFEICIILVSTFLLGYKRINNVTRYWTLLNIGNMFIRRDSDRNILTNTAFEEKKIFSTAYSTDQVSKKIKHC